MMNKEFKDWLIGLFLFLLISATMYGFNKMLLPHVQYNLLEWWGIVMMVVIIKTGMDSWNNDEE